LSLAAFLAFERNINYFGEYSQQSGLHCRWVFRLRDCS
jgi:hypothetical protein